jgi:erythromycin esterase-like protein
MRRASHRVTPDDDAFDAIRHHAEALAGIDERDFGAAFDRFAAARVVLLGEATHGTSEFYRARAAITRRLVEHHGFSIIAVEADWPDAAAIDRYVRHKEHQVNAPPPFRRFPTWMWHNAEVEIFADWLRGWNAVLPVEERVGFYGLDLYSMNASIRAVLDYLNGIDPEAARIARERYACLTSWQRDPAAYGRAALSAGFALCERPVLEALKGLFEKQLEYSRRNEDEFFDAAQNARLVAAAERYYRIMYYGSAESWNLRDTHMFETLTHLLARHPDSKAVVWAHNSHIGDASATEMGTLRGELNIGELCRGKFNGQCNLIGFGTHSGTVAAASDWDGPVEFKTIKPSRPDSYEYLCHEAAPAVSLLDLRKESNALHDALLTSRLERAIGVIYRPETERQSHYFEASLSNQFDAFVWFDETLPVTPLDRRKGAGVPETYPFGV